MDQKQHEMRAYVDGVEIDKIPELAEVCAMDDWIAGLLAWASKNRPDMEMDAIFTGDAQDLLLREVWIGGAPPMRALEIGGVVKSFERPVRKS
jgi:hypothetical protein